MNNLWSEFTSYIICVSLILSCGKGKKWNNWEYVISSFYRHLKEIQELQSRQKQEIEFLYTKLGKVPPAVIIPPAAPLSGRRRRPTKGKSSKSSRSSSQGNKSPQTSGKVFWNGNGEGSLLNDIFCFGSLVDKLSIHLFASIQTACLLSPFTGNLSAQSAPTILPQQQTLHPPGSTQETGQNHLKPSPSSENLYSAFTSDGAISIPSLSVPGQGKHWGSALWRQAFWGENVFLIITLIEWACMVLEWSWQEKVMQLRRLQAWGTSLPQWAIHVESV